MEELRHVAAKYLSKNLYNIDESGLFYGMRPRKSYLAPSEDPRRARGTELQRHKARFTIVLCVNADGSHSVPVRYVERAAEPICFRENRFDGYRANNLSQENAWMDSVWFNKWIHWWYTELRRENSDDILLIMDNCCGHSTDTSLPGLRIETLPVNSLTAHAPCSLANQFADE